MASKKPKTVSLSFRVAIEEREALEKSAVEAGTTLAGYIASTLAEARSGRKPVVATPSPAPAEPPPRVPGISLSDPAALSELKRIGININQLAHATNAAQPPSQRTMVDAFAGLFGLLSEPERFLRNLAEVKAPLDAAQVTPAKPAVSPASPVPPPDHARLSELTRKLEAREAEMRSLVDQLDVMRRRERAMGDRITQLEAQVARPPTPAPKPPLPLPASKPPMAPPSPPRPGASPSPPSVSSEPARATPTGKPPVLPKPAPAQSGYDSPRPASRPLRYSDDMTDDTTPGPYSTPPAPHPYDMPAPPPKHKSGSLWQRVKSAITPASTPATPPDEPRRSHRLSARTAPRMPRHLRQENRYDSPHPQARFELQDRRGVHPSRPAKGDERPGRLGFLRKLWGE